MEKQRGVFVFNTEYYSALKVKEVLPHATVGGNFE